MVSNHRHDVGKRAVVRDHIGANIRMTAHDLPFVGRQRLSLIQNFIPHANFPEIMKMPRICEDLKAVAKASPSPQQVDVLVSGFDRLYNLWRLAKSGLG